MPFEYDEFLLGKIFHVLPSEFDKVPEFKVKLWRSFADLEIENENFNRKREAQKRKK